MIQATERLLKHTGIISLLPFFQNCFHLIKFKQTTPAGYTDTLMAQTLLCDTLSMQSVLFRFEQVFDKVIVTEPTDSEVL